MSTCVPLLIICDGVGTGFRLVSTINALFFTVSACESLLQVTGFEQNENKQSNSIIHKIQYVKELPKFKMSLDKSMET